MYGVVNVWSHHYHYCHRHHLHSPRVLLGRELHLKCTAAPFVNASYFHQFMFTNLSSPIISTNLYSPIYLLAQPILPIYLPQFMFSNLLSYVQQFMVPNLFSPIYLFNASYFHQFIQLAMQCKLCRSATQVVCFCLPWIVEHFVRNPAGHGVGWLYQSANGSGARSGRSQAEDWGS